MSVWELHIMDKIYSCDKCCKSPGFFQECDEHFEDYYLDHIKHLKKDMQEIERQIENILRHIDFRKEQINKLNIVKKILLGENA